MKKYEITNESIEFEGKTLYRIKALLDFDDVKAGDLGGFIECEDNLSNCDKCWIYDDAKVRNNAVLCDKAMAIENAEVSGNARLNGNSYARQHSTVTDNARLTMNAQAWGYATINDDAFLQKDAHIDTYSNWITIPLYKESEIIVTAYKTNGNMYNVTFSNSPHSFSLEELERKVEVCKTEEEKKHIKCVVKEIKEFFEIETE